jgi:hypothetical protein
MGAQPAKGTIPHAEDDPRELLLGWRRCLVKVHVTVLVTGEDPIEHKNMQMKIKIDGSTESLRLSAGAGKLRGLF